MPKEKPQVTKEPEASKPEKPTAKPEKAEEPTETTPLVEALVEAPVEADLSFEEGKPPAQVIMVANLQELVQPLLELMPQQDAEEDAQPSEAAAEVVAAETADSDHQARLLEFENWAWNNRSATVAEKQEAYERIVG